MTSLEGLGVSLQPLTREDLQELQDPRGDLEPGDGEGETVTDEALGLWTESAENGSDHAWLVRWEGRPIGLARLTGHDPARKVAEGEVRLWTGGRDGAGAMRVAILIADWGFGQLALETITSTVAKTDRRSASFNLALGHVFDPEATGCPTLTSRLTREAFEKRRPGLLAELSRLEGFGLELRRLRREDLELVRGWRNDPEIRRYMSFREHITEQMQQQWFESIDNESNHYSLVIWQGTPIGLSHVKDCDYVRKTGEGGLFLWAREFRDSVYALRVAIVGTDWCFDELGLETITGTVLKSNRRAARFNAALGHVFDPEVPGSPTLTCRLTREAYAKARCRLFTLVA